MGNSGLLITPVAELSEDRTLYVGYSYFGAEQRQFVPRSSSGLESSASRTIFANLTFLPFLEMTLRVAKPYDAGQSLGIGDRSIFMKIRLLKEKGLRPGLSLGLHDVLSSFGAYFQTNYLVASKSFSLSGDWSVHSSLGYGMKFKNTNEGYLLGLFGNTSLRWKQLQLVMEYDADQFNTGIKCSLFDRLFVNIGALNMKDFSAGGSFRMNL
ncbi:MAG: YjbH domain-containing protein [Bacteroidota bacterium]